MSRLIKPLSWMLTGAAVMGAVLLLFGAVALPTPGQNTGTAVLPPVAAQSSSSYTDLESQFIQLYEQANPAVVSVQVRQPITTSANLPLPFPFGFSQGGQQYVYGQGSGFVYDTQGHIVTNYHVAGEADQIMVVLADGNSVEARLVGGDPDSDLAVIQIDPSGLNLQPLTLGDSDALEVGQMVVAIGNPFGLQGTMTTGIVSALGRMLESQAAAIGGGRFNIPDIIQTDAAINPGNSGGPLLNLAGQVVGVNTAIESSVQQNSGIGFAVPANMVARVVPALIEHGSYEHPWLGIAGATLTPRLGSAMGLEASQRGVLIDSVSANSPADEAGLRGSNRQVRIDGQQVSVGGDVIVSVDGQPVNSFDDLLDYIANEISVGQTITLGVLRDGQRIDVQVTLGARPHAGG